LYGFGEDVTVCYGARMHSWQLPLLGLSDFPADLSEFEIAYFFSFSAAEQHAIAARRGASYRLAAALHLGFLKMTGRPLDPFEPVPSKLLAHLGQEIGVPTPELTSLHVLYRRGRTLFDQQLWAARMLGFQPLTERQQRVLLTVLRREARKAGALEELISYSRRWLYEHRVLIPGERRVRDLARTAMTQAEEELWEALGKAVPLLIRQQWETTVFARYRGRQTMLEWLHQPPRRRGPQTLERQLATVLALRELGLHHYPLPMLRLEHLLASARRLRRRAPRHVRRLREPRRSLEVIGFLQLTLLQTTDIAIALAGKLMLDIWRRARQNVRDRHRQAAAQLTQCLREVRRVVHDPRLSARAVRQRLQDLLRSLNVLTFPSQAAEVRWTLSEDARRIRPLLRQLLQLEFQGEEGSPVLAALAQLRRWYEAQQLELPDDLDLSFAPEWTSLLHGSDRRRAFRAFEAATLAALRRGLRNGSLWLEHSLAYCRRDQHFIPAAEWERERRRYYRHLGLPPTLHRYTTPLLATLAGALEEVAEAVRAGTIVIENGQLHLPALVAEATPASLEATQERLFQQIGTVQLPELIMEMDSQIRFSWTLLGREPRSVQELLALYGGLLAQGTELTVAEVALMMPEVPESAIHTTLPLFEESRVLRQANANVVEFLRRHPVVRHWGEGTTASADAMSVDVSRHLWNARVDPRRRTYGIGLYTHLLDQWGIIYDQPVVLNERQAGVAIEGVVGQTSTLLQRLAVDTHGYTHLGMAVSKLVGFDLCPRLKNLRERRLYVPREMTVPDELLLIVDRSLSLETVEAGWDQFVRLVASIEGGWTSAALVLGRLGSAARGDPLHKTGEALGKLLRSLFLCDYFTIVPFRRELSRLLNHGELLHTLQRAIHAGSLAAARGRRHEELEAVSGALTLLANLTMAWTTHHLQQVVDQWTRDGHPVHEEFLRHIAPVHIAAINFRGTFHFPLERYGKRLIPDRNKRATAS
jgi:TnpA family transposase